MLVFWGPRSHWGPWESAGRANFGSGRGARNRRVGPKRASVSELSAPGQPGEPRNKHLPGAVQTFRPRSASRQQDAKDACPAADRRIRSVRLAQLGVTLCGLYGVLLASASASMLMLTHMPREYGSRVSAYHIQMPCHSILIMYKYVRPVPVSCRMPTTHPVVQVAYCPEGSPRVGPQEPWGSWFWPR